MKRFLKAALGVVGLIGWLAGVIPVSLVCFIPICLAGPPMGKEDAWAWRFADWYGALGGRLVVQALGRSTKTDQKVSFPQHVSVVTVRRNKPGMLYDGKRYYRIIDPPRQNICPPIEGVPTLTPTSLGLTRGHRVVPMAIVSTGLLDGVVTLLEAAGMEPPTHGGLMAVVGCLRDLKDRWTFKAGQKGGNSDAPV